MTMKAKLLQQSRIDWLIGGGLSGLALILYSLTLAPTVLEADAGEFQFVPWLPGIAHPPGYPLYTLLGWLWSHLFPLGNVAWRLNLLSAVLAAGAIGVTYAISRQLIEQVLPGPPPPAKRLAALLAATTFAVSPTLWSQAIIAEVYALHSLLIALIMGLVISYRQLTPLLALTVGLSLTHHVTTMFLLPALVIFCWLTIPKSVNSYGDKAKTIFSSNITLTFLCLVFPLSLYLYLPLIAPVTPYSTLSLSDQQRLVLYENSWSGFWRHVTARDFASEVRPLAVDGERLTMMGQDMRQQVGWGGMFLAGAGLLTLLAQKRWPLLMLTGLAFVTLTAFNLSYFIGDIFVLFIPVWWLVCLWLGLGSLGLAHWLARRFVESRLRGDPQPFARHLEQQLGQRAYRLIVIGLLCPLFIGPAYQLITLAPVVSQATNTAASERWQQILTEPLPDRAVLLSNDRNEIMPMWYYQYVDHRRPDLLGLFPLIVPHPAYANVGRVLDQAWLSERPVFLIKPMAGLQVKADLTPVGSLFRATPYDPTPTYPRQITLADQIDLVGYDLQPARLTPPADLQVTLYWQPRQPLTVDYSSYVHVVDEAGQGVGQHDHQPGGEVYPTHLWPVGEILRDQHVINLPATLAAGRYRLRVGLYHQPVAGQFVNLGPGEFIGEVMVTR